MKTMQRRLILVGFVLAAAGMSAAASEGLSQVEKVYLLPMGAGLDQYLANQLTVRGVFQVVTDPKQADAILTDEIGEVFEKQLDKLYPPPPPPPPPKTEEAGEKGAATAPEEMTFPEAPERPRSTFSRGRGNVFLVGRQSREVVWSIYHLPKNRSAREMNKAAETIVEELQKALGK